MARRRIIGQIRYIAHSDGRAPRLVLDNTVCGLNPRCWVPERSTLPACKDILRAFPIREFQGDHMGFSLDVKAAHKRIVLHEREQGLVGFTLNNRLFFYRVTPFGAVFSAHWWGRLGGFLLRIFHRLIWWAHTGLLYVDDYFFTQCSDMMPVSATLLCFFCQICKIPTSWGKCELGGSLQWIGWQFPPYGGLHRSSTAQDLQAFGLHCGYEKGVLEPPDVTLRN